jgi:hypothetical protein
MNYPRHSQIVVIVRQALAGPLILTHCDRNDQHAEMHYCKSGLRQKNATKWPLPESRHAKPCRI